MITMMHKAPKIMGTVCVCKSKIELFVAPYGKPVFLGFSGNH